MSDIRQSAYKGRLDPQKVAKRLMFWVIALLILGFFRAAIENRWFVPFIEFIES